MIDITIENVEALEKRAESAEKQLKTALRALEEQEQEAEEFQKRAEKAEKKTTLRDQFAMAALTGMLANGDEPRLCDFDSASAELAGAAFHYAEVMIMAREGRPKLKGRFSV